MADLEDDLRATSDSLMRDLDRMRQLEEEKRGLPPDDPRLVELATEIEGLSERTQTTSAAQREIAEEIQQTDADE